MLFSRRLNSAQVIQLTSPSPNDGTSTVAANLSVSIAQLGRRVLLIDADNHRPRQHAIFHLTDESPNPPATMESMLSASTATTVENLSVLSLRAWNSEGGEFYANGAFARMIAQAREAYDVIVIDSEPLWPFPIHA